MFNFFHFYQVTFHQVVNNAEILSLLFSVLVRWKGTCDERHVEPHGRYNKKYLLTRYLPIVPDSVLDHLCLR